MQAGKTIAARRERMTSDSERERVRKTYRKRRLTAFFAALLLGAVMIYLGVRAISGWVGWMKEEKKTTAVVKNPTVEVINENTGKKFDDNAAQASEKLSSRMKEYIADLEEEFYLLGYKITRARVPADKMREIDLEIDGVIGFIKVSIDRNAAVSAEDGDRMIKYLAGQGITEFSYIDVRLPGKAYWK